MERPGFSVTQRLVHSDVATTQQVLTQPEENGNSGEATEDNQRNQRKE
jgi:hypothetical protein